MGCGVAFEALNHSGATERENLLVVLNDNRWSIAQTVGALTRYLTKIFNDEWMKERGFL